VLRLEHGRANALDIDLMSDLTRALNDVRAGGTRAVVLTGTGSIFSAGVDLHRVVSGGAEYTSKFVPALAEFFLDLFEYPLPLVAAINGHAIAGGCLIGCACDYRLMAASTGTIGVPELLVGVRFPAVAIEILRSVVPPHEVQVLALTGRTCLPDEAARRGLVHEVVPGGELLQHAMRIAQRFAAIPSDVFAATKLALHADALDRLRRDRSLEEVSREWAREETHARIRQYMERVVKKNQ